MKKFLILFALIIGVNICIGQNKKTIDSLNNNTVSEIESPLALEDWMMNDAVWETNSIFDSYQAFKERFVKSHQFVMRFHHKNMNLHHERFFIRKNFILKK